MIDINTLSKVAGSLNIASLQQAAADIKNKIIQTTNINGGHYGSPLSITDIVVAMAHVFDFERDKIVFDTGHQCYPYKIITNRANQFNNIRKLGGISGFPDIAESDYDHFGTGHSATSVGAIYGMLLAGSSGNHIACIGDSAITGGLFFEALNMISVLNKKSIIVINDNDMSIAPSVGSLKFQLKNLVNQYAGQKAQLQTDNNVFNSFGCLYYGVCNGHSMADIVAVLQEVKSLQTNKTIVVHFRTHKDDHAVKGTQVGVSDGISKQATGDIMQAEMDNILSADSSAIVVSPAMLNGSGLKNLQQKFTDRVIDVAIAEQLAVTCCAGAAKSGANAFCVLYSTFAQRAYDQIIHDVAVQNLPVKFLIDRAGFVGADGKTHQGLYDISMFANVHNMTVLAPADALEMRAMLHFVAQWDGPICMRFPKAIAVGDESAKFNPIKYGKFNIVNYGQKVCLLSFGHILPYVQKASLMLQKHGINATVINARFAKPFDTDGLKDILQNHSYLFTFELGAKGGFEAIVNREINKLDNKNCSVNSYYIDKDYDHGTELQQMEMSALNAGGLYQKMCNKLNIQL